MQGFKISRRKFLTAASLGASGLVTAGCDVLDSLGDRDNALRNFMEGANDLTYRVQRLLAGRDALAQEFSEADIRQPQRPNGVTAPDDDFYKGLLAEELRRLAAGSLGPGRKAAVAVARAADRHAVAHADHPARLRRGLELHRQMDRRAAVAACSTRPW